MLNSFEIVETKEERCIVQLKLRLLLGFFVLYLGKLAHPIVRLPLILKGVSLWFQNPEEIGLNLK